VHPPNRATVLIAVHEMELARRDRFAYPQTGIRILAA